MDLKNTAVNGTQSLHFEIFWERTKLPQIEGDMTIVVYKDRKTAKRCNKS